MKLYDSLRAPNPRRVRWLMAEKNITDIEIVMVDVFKGEHKTPEYLAKCGLPNVPALEFDDGTAITESVAIARYLETVYPEPNMLGKDAREVAVIEMWTRRVENLLGTPLMLSVRHTHPALAALDTQIPAIAETNMAAAARAMKVFDRQLAKTEFLAGDRVTMADVVAATSIDFARMIKFTIPEELTHLNRWYDAMMARPAAKAGV
jgi:glutathione S-transferase